MRDIINTEKRKEGNYDEYFFVELSAMERRFNKAFHSEYMECITNINEEIEMYKIIVKMFEDEHLWAQSAKLINENGCVLGGIRKDEATGEKYAYYYINGSESCLELLHEWSKDEKITEADVSCVFGQVL